MVYVTVHKVKVFQNHGNDFQILVDGVMTLGSQGKSLRCDQFHICCARPKYLYICDTKSQTIIVHVGKLLLVNLSCTQNGYYSVKIGQNLVQVNFSISL